jgi:hypothetical protein
LIVKTVLSNKRKTLHVHCRKPPKLEDAKLARCAIKALLLAGGSQPQPALVN